MGIKEVWNLLTPFCEKRPLYTLAGQIVAVDLAGWILEAQCVGSNNFTITQKCLCNIFYRTRRLLLIGCYPVFVLEGKAPVLKHKTMEDRSNAQQKKGAKPKTNKTTYDRRNFQRLLKRCEEMLNYLGLVCLIAEGEAEQLCGYLNAKGLVSACITSDSDCFAYGARVVYRHFSGDAGTVDVYDLDKIQPLTGLGQEKMIALALFCGSDYNNGVYGVSRNTALDFMKHISDGEILERIKTWRTMDIAAKERALSKICRICDHKGDIVKHIDKGCIPCGTVERCTASSFSKFKELKLELDICAKALRDPDFPNEDVINEFLIPKDNLTSVDSVWHQPDFVNYMKISTQVMRWDEEFSLKNFLPIFTRWHLKNPDIINNLTTKNSLSGLKGAIFPKNIVAVRTIKGIPSYEINWEDRFNCFDKLLSNNLKGLLVSIEPKILLEKSFPTIITEYEEASLAKRSKSKRKTTQNKKPRKKADDLKIPPQVNSIGSYFKKSKVSQLIQAESKTVDVSFDLNCSSFGDEDDLNLSLVVERIVSKPIDLLKNIKPSDCFEQEVETKYDLSELDYNNLEFVGNQNKYESNSGDETINYEIDELELNSEIIHMKDSVDDCESVEIDKKSLIENDLNDTFDLHDAYVPLIERIKQKY